jgi:hypothetical protein
LKIIHSFLGSIREYIDALAFLHWVYHTV